MVARTQIDRRASELRVLLESLDRIEVGDRLADLEANRASLRRVVASYLIPKFANPAEPLTVVFAGPTGSGKSTLINSLTRLDLSKSGVLRPTTTRPLVLCHPDRVDRYAVVDGVECDVVSGEAPALESMTLIDTPDIDSTARHHRDMAERLMDSADVVVLIASALRYADDVPWQVLRRASARGAEVVHVLNRVASTSSGAAIDYRSRLESEQMGQGVIVVPEYHLAPGRQMLPAVAVKALARRLAEVASSHEGDVTEIRERVFDTTMGQVAEFVSAAEAAAEEQRTADEYLADRLAAASSGLSIPELAESLVTPPTKAQAWVKAERRNDEQRERLEHAIGDRLKLEIGAQVRTVAIDECSHREIEPGPVIDGVDDVIAAAVEGWMHFVQRMAEPLRSRDQWPGQLALIGSSLGVDTFEVIEALFAEDAFELADRARRELEGRIEVVFSHLAERIIEQSGPRITVEDVMRLRGALPSAVAGLVGIDA